jgi:predicted MPP superfamily phosphohydrolase
MATLRRLDLEFDALPAALDGLRIAQISDVHVGMFVQPEMLWPVMEAVAREAPDLVVLTGDLVDDRRKVDATLEVLGSARPRLGTWACLGNHEHYTGLQVMRSAFDRSSAHLLVNEAVQLRHGGATLELSAVDYPLGRAGRMTDGTRFDALAETALVRRAQGGDFRVHLAHHPHAWDAARVRGAQLTLSGHTHGGQVTAFGRPVFAPFFRYIRGLYEQRGQKLFVHSGTGHWLPVRINCPAEVALLTLRPGLPAPATARAA